MQVTKIITGIAILHDLESGHFTTKDAYDIPDQDAINRQIKECQNLLDPKKWADIKCCAVCGIGFPNIKFPEVSISVLPYCEVPNIYLLCDSNKEFILDPCGIKNQLVQICSMDLLYLSDKLIWKFALVNQNYEGSIPDYLPELSYLEQNVISKVRMNQCIIKLKRAGTYSHYGWKGHLICRKQAPESILESTLPISSEALFQYLQVIIVNGPHNQSLHSIARKIVHVR